MSTSPYEYIYDFPGGYYRHHPHHHKPDIPRSYAQEMNNSINIYDAFKNLRYVVQLSSTYVYVDNNVIRPKLGYKTKVSQMIYVQDENVQQSITNESNADDAQSDSSEVDEETESNEDPSENMLPSIDTADLSGHWMLSTFLEIPDNGDYCFDYLSALETFQTSIKKYQSLVDAEMKDFRDIDIYKDQIDYEIEQVSCCSNCKWCIKENLKHHHHHDWHLHCACPENQQVFNYGQEFPQLHKNNQCQMHSWRKLPWQKPEDIKALYGDQWDPSKFPVIFFPVVDALGRCKNYVQCICKPQ